MIIGFEQFVKNPSVQVGVYIFRKRFHIF